MIVLLLKVAVTPLLVAFVSLAQRWWGPAIGGLLIGLPWVTGPVLLLLVLSRGAAYGAAVCVGVELGVLCISAFMLAYGLMAAVSRWPASLAVAVLAFLASAVAVGDPRLLDWTAPGARLWMAAGIGAASLCAVLALVPRPRGEAPAPALPWWDIPARMATAAAIVTTVMVSAEALGPQLAGVLSTYPILLTVIGTFTHHNRGADAVWRILRGAAASLLGFVAFFLVVGLTLPAAGVAGAYALGAAASLAITASLVAAHRLRQRRAAAA